MQAESAPPAASPPPRRLPSKLLIVAGGATLALLLVLGGLLAWLWPAPPAATAKAKAPRPAAQHAAAAASAAAPPLAMPQPLPLLQGAAAAQDAASAAPRAEAVAPLPAAPLPEAPPVRAARTAAVEASLDKLQRRLGEVLGARGAIDAAHPGEWRVLTRVAVAPAAPRERAAAADARHVEWGYAGMKGPQAWGRLHPEFAACANGRRQSPIDIRDGLAVALEPIRFDYRPGAFGVIDDGHTVQVNVAPGSAIELMGRRYALQQFHFHRPSEERIGGRRFEMSAHLVHKDDAGRIAVVAVMLQRGAEQPLLQTVWSHLPLEKGEELVARAPLDPAQLLPPDRRYYSDMGSLTTPPCSEGVLWLVLQQPVGVSARQIDVFARLYPMNARPVQRSAGRTIKPSN